MRLLICSQFSPQEQAGRSSEIFINKILRTKSQVKFENESWIIGLRVILTPLEAIAQIRFTQMKLLIRGFQRNISK